MTIYGAVSFLHRFAFRSFHLSLFPCVVSFYRSILLSCAFHISFSVSFSVPHVLIFNHISQLVLVCGHRWSWSLVCIFNESSPAEEASRIKTKAFNNARSQWKLSFRNELFSVFIGMFEILFIWIHSQLFLILSPFCNYLVHRCRPFDDFCSSLGKIEGVAPNSSHAATSRVRTIWRATLS